MDNEGTGEVRLERMDNTVDNKRILTLKGTLMVIQLDISYKTKLDAYHIFRRCHPTLLDNLQ